MRRNLRVWRDKCGYFDLRGQCEYHVKSQRAKALGFNGQVRVVVEGINPTTGEQSTSRA